MKKLNDPPITKKPEAVIRERSTAAATRRAPRLPSVYYLSPEGAVCGHSSNGVAAEVERTSDRFLPPKGDGAVYLKANDAKNSESKNVCEAPDMIKMQLNSTVEAEAFAVKKVTSSTNNKQKKAVEDLKFASSLGTETSLEPMNEKPTIRLDDYRIRSPLFLPADCYLSTEFAVRPCSYESVAAEINGVSESVGSLPKGDTDVFDPRSSETKSFPTSIKEDMSNESEEYFVQAESQATNELSPSDIDICDIEPIAVTIEARIETCHVSDSESCANAVAESSTATPGTCHYQGSLVASTATTSSISSQESAIIRNDVTSSNDDEDTGAGYVAGGNCIEQMVEEEVTASSVPEKKKLRTLKDLGISKRSFGQERLRSLPKEKKPDLTAFIIQSAREGSSTNVEILVGKKAFKCYWLILQLCSPYFKELCYKPQIALDETRIAPEAFELVYQMLLTESPPKLRHKELMLVFQGARFLRIEFIICECWSLIERKPMYNDLGMLVCHADAKRLQITELADVMLPRLSRVYLILLASTEYLTLSYNEVHVLLQLNSLCVQDEIQVLLGAVLWLNHDWPDRKAHVTELMRCVRFSLLSPLTLVSLGRNAELELPLQRVLQDEEARDRICKSLLLSYMKAKGEYSDNQFPDLVKNPRAWVMHCDGSKPSYCTEPNATEQNAEQVMYWECFLDHLNIIRADANGYYESLVPVLETANAEQKSA